MPQVFWGGMKSTLFRRRKMSAKKTDKKIEGNVLALGEFTGHHHTAVGQGVAVFETETGERYMEAPNGATITHEEHKPIDVPAGEYNRKIVVEVDPFAEEVRQVRD
jgi:hypothetical protein